MRKVFSVLSVVTLVAVIAAQSAFAGDCPNAKKKDIVDTAVGAGSFKTLVAAVSAAGLVETLKGRARSRSSPRRTKRLPSSRPARSKACSSRRTRTS